MISFNPTALTQPTPLIQRKAKARHIFPQENLSEFYQTLIHNFNLQQKQSLRLKLIFFNHGTKTFQAEGHGRHDHHIPYGGR